MYDTSMKDFIWYREQNASVNNFCYCCLNSIIYCVDTFKIYLGQILTVALEVALDSVLMT